VLGNKNGVILHGCLLAVVFYISGGKTGAHYLFGVLSYGAKTLFAQVVKLFFPQLKGCAEFRVLKLLQCFFYGLHAFSP